MEIDAFETGMPVKTQRKKTRIAEELIGDEGNYSDSLADFRVNMFNLIMKSIVQLL